MHRRDFLKYLLGTAVASFVDYEKLLWVPGEKIIFIPSKRQIEFLSESGIIELELNRVTKAIPYLQEILRIHLKIDPGRTMLGWDVGVDASWTHPDPRFYNTNKGRGPHRVSKASRD